MFDKLDQTHDAIQEDLDLLNNYFYILEPQLTKRQLNTFKFMTEKLERKFLKAENLIAKLKNQLENE